MRAPTQRSNPVSSARWIRPGEAPSPRGRIPSSRQMSRIWPCTSNQSRIRAGERACRRQNRRIDSPGSFATDRKRRQRLTIPRKSERVSAKRSWAAWAADLRPELHSRGSGTLRKLAMTSTSATQPSESASSSMRPILGSSGSRASRRPTFVSSSSASTAPSSRRSRRPSLTWRRSGGSMNGNRSTSRMPSESMRSSTAARSERRTSGSGCAGRVSRSASS